MSERTEKNKGPSSTLSEPLSAQRLSDPGLLVFTDSRGSYLRQGAIANISPNHSEFVTTKMETSVKENIILPDSTTSTFLNPKDFVDSQKAVEAVCAVSTDTTEMEHFSDLFNVTSCSAPFTLMDEFTTAGSQLASVPQPPSSGLENVKQMTSLKTTGHQEPVFSLLQSTSSNPTLGTAVLTNTNSEMVTSTTLDQPLLEVSDSRGHKSVVVSSMVNNDIYTLTLTDGSVMQLKVQNDTNSQAAEGEQPHHQPHHIVQQPQNEDITDLDSVSQTWLPSNNGQDGTNGGRTSSASVASYGDDVALPFTVQGPAIPEAPPADTLLSPASPHSEANLQSPTSPYDYDYNPPSVKYKRSSKRLSSKASKITTPPSRSFSVCSEDYSASNSAASDFDDDNDDNASLFSLFNCMEKVTIERLKAKLSTLPEGQTDLGALLVAAKIDLTVEDIVGPPLTTVKKIMEAKGLADWQMTLCLKIRRRKKNTVRKKGQIHFPMFS